MQQALDPISAHILRNYGGKRALGLSVWHAVRNRLGGYAPYRRVDWRRVSRVVFVCKGNICRSPFASVSLRSPGLVVESAGLEAAPDQPADPRATAVAERFGADLSAHRSTPLQDMELASGDLLVAFEPAHADRMLQSANRPPGVQVTLLGLWSPAPAQVYFHDPYGLPEAYFQRCFERIDHGLAGLRDRLGTPRAALESGT